MRVGLDFGTTNSGVAHYDGRTLRVFPVDLQSRDAQTVKSLLYITHELESFIGQAAIMLYFSQNLGCSVHFDPDPERDSLAQERLERAAHPAGFQGVDFEVERLAAASHYELGLDHAENVLVFDLGGGTLDVTVMRLAIEVAVSCSPAAECASEAICSTSGSCAPACSAASDMAPPTDGTSDCRCGSTSLRHWPNGRPSPPALPSALCPSSSRHWPPATGPRSSGYSTPSSPNYGFKMFQEAQRAKCELSDREEAAIRLMDEDIRILEPLTREQLEGIIAADVARVERCVEEAETASALAPEEIDVVLATGGSSAIPIFQRMLERKFRAGKVREHDLFAAVTQGLAMAAYYRDQTGKGDTRQPQRG